MSDSPSGCSGSYTCYDNNVSGDNLITGLIFNTCIGLLCIIGFWLWRGAFGVYHCREFVPGVRRRPPKLSVAGHQRLWSWITALTNVSDREYLASAGFDALVSIRIISYGVALFLPFTIIGIGVLLPVNYTAGYLEAVDAAANATTITSTTTNLTNTFLKMTISNIPPGSPLLWVHFVFMVVFVLWACYLLLIYYEEHIALQQLVSAARIGTTADVPAADAPPESSTKAFASNGRPPGTLPGEAQHADEDSGEDSSEAAVPDTEICDVPNLAFAATEAGAAAAAEARHEGGMPTGGGAGEAPHAGGCDGGGSLTVSSAEKSPGSGSSLSGQPSPRGAKEDGSDAAHTLRLWPVRAPDPPSLAMDNPPYAGQYTVVVLDEPPRRFEIRSAKLFGRHIRFTNVQSLRHKQLEANRANWFWDGGGGNQSLGSRRRRGSSTAAAEATGTAGKLKQMWDGVAQRTRQALPFANNNEDEASLVNTKRMRAVASTFQRLFDDDFDCVVPIFRTQKVDAWLQSLFWCQTRLARAELALGAAEKHAAAAEEAARPRHERKVKQIAARVLKLRQEESALQGATAEARAAAIAAPPCPTFLAVFRTAKAAAMATALNVNPLHWRGLYLVPGPDPENANWPALQRGWWGRQLRSLVALFFILLVMLFPFGAITGSFSQLEAALCGGPQGGTGSLTGTWFCESEDFWPTLLRNLITAVLPSILMSVFQAVILPVVIYSCAHLESRHLSLSDLEKRIAALLFYWNVFNFFFGALLGGAVFSGLRSILEDPKNIIPLIANSLSASSNFFINYVSYRALAMCTFRLFWPHSCVLGDILKWLHIFPKGKTPQDIALETPLRNCRFSRDIGVSMFAIYIAATGFAVVSPFILPLTLIYFALLLPVWRYQQLYVFQAAFSGRGQMWSFTAHRIVACLSIMVLFTGAMFFVKKAYLLGALSLLVVEVFLILFHKYLGARYDAIFMSTPVAILESAPRVPRMNPLLYTPPPLRPRAEGWHLEWGKAWQGWGAPRYTL